MTDVRWIGREGEKIFSLLCSRRKVTCNKAEEDDRGWDFIVHFPAPAIFDAPIDQRSTGSTALVQIKATRVDAGRWSISLKNALSLAKSPLPAFIVCVGLDENDGATYRAVHIWQAEAARILKAARQAYVEGDEATNHRTISFDLGEDRTRPDILAWMLAEIETIGETRYAAAKQLLLDTLGFEDGHGIARLKLSTASPDALADLQLGLLSSIEFDHFSFTGQRFGIENPMPSIEVGRGVLEVMPRGRQGTLRIRSSHGHQEYLPAEIFSASLPGRRRTKGRVRAGCIEMVMRPKRPISVKCRLDGDERTTLENIGAYALVRRSRRDDRLAIALRTTGAFVDFGPVSMKSNNNDDWLQIFMIAQAIKKLVAFENATPIEACLNEIIACFAPLSVLDALVASRSLRVEYTPFEDEDEKVQTFLAYTSVEIAGVELGAVAHRSVVSDEMVGSRRRIDMGPATILHASVGDGRAHAMRDYYLEELDRLSEAVDVLAVGNLQRCVSADEDREMIVDQPRQVPLRRRLADGS